MDDFNISFTSAGQAHCFPKDPNVVDQTDPKDYLGTR